MNTILAICIPTYNRARYLKDGIQKLLPGIRAYEIPIYISDNGSIDDTEAVVKDLQTLYPYIFYSRNKENEGADFNFEKALKMSKTQYSWLMSDDDIVNIQYIAEIMEVLSEDKLDLMGLNGYCQGDVRVKDVKSKFYTNKNDLLKEVAWHLQWISCLILSRELIDQADFEKYRNTYLLQFGIIFDYLAKKKDIAVYWNADAVVMASLLTVEVDLNQGWSDQAFFIFTKSWSEVINAFPACYTQEAKDACIIGHCVKSKLFDVQSLIRLSLRGDYTIKVLKKYWFYIRKYVKQNIGIMILIALLPRLEPVLYKQVKKIFLFAKRM